MTAPYKILRDLQSFSRLNDKQVKILSDITLRKNFNKDDYIFSEGNEAEGFYIITDGLVKLFNSSGSTRIFTLNLLDEGGLFGLSTLAGVNVYPYTAQALVNTDTLFIYYDDFLKIIKEEPEISIVILESLCKDICNLIETTTSISFKKVPVRLAEYILQESKESKDTINLSFKKSELASLLGTIPETLSRAFKYLRKLELIKTSASKITILNRDGLKKLIKGKLDDSNYIFM